MSKKTQYGYPKGGLSSQNELLSDRAVLKNGYILIPQKVMQDIVVSYFPYWESSRAWVLASPSSGVSRTFSQAIVEIFPSGGSRKPELDSRVQSILFILDGKLEIKIGNKDTLLTAGSYVYIPPNQSWEIKNNSKLSARFNWTRKVYNNVSGIKPPKAFIKDDRKIKPIPMSGTNGSWSTTRFVDPQDLSHDMHVNIVNLKPGGKIPFMETHVMEHGIYILQGNGVYRLNNDWVEVEAGDFICLKAFCPQACYAGGPQDFRYLLYKDVNRQISL